MTLFESYFEKKEFDWKPGLERIKKAVEEINLKKFPSIIVAGTNGKGSTSHMIAKILKEHGYKTGLFTSPHLFRFNERFKVDLKEVDDEVINDCFKEIFQVVEKYSLTYFEAAFLLSLSIFYHFKVDFAVFEVGLGGRLDATNAVNHDIAVITHIDYDHRDYLGNTIEEIAKEKIAVINNNIPAVVSENKSIVKELVLSKTNKAFIYGEDFDVADVTVSIEGTTFKYGGNTYLTTLIGRHQAINAVTALKVCETILGEKFKPELSNKGLKISLLGRFQLIRKNPTVIFDVAHNVDALKNLFKTAKEIGIKADVIFSGLKDKDIENNLKVIRDYLNYSKGTLFVTEIDNPRGMKFEKLLELTRKVGIEKTKRVDRIDINYIKNDTIITGSFYIVEKLDGINRI
ncbi:bifunctional folylpolyglutamate synthase/dihydrofolate synthase [Desulfurobacterium thermolithotrophum]|uniref:bifunctional folylpolyglutamate synthase/dihydrofolate synthase n=1 Tax=Desulfurobacterium thermolithotrophum TaxID=64160 RepID=UPI0013D1238B|nr:Mur ligase family protein [Desulfurobacterium thermolithotrophum]